MGKRVSNKKGRQRVAPARSTKTWRRHLERLIYRRRKQAILEIQQAQVDEVRKRFGTLDFLDE